MSLDALVINLTRFGDLLQSQPLLTDLAESGMSVGLLCQDNFSGALDLLADVREAWLLPGARLLSDTDGKWQNAVVRLEELASDIRVQGRPRLIINLTPSLPGRLLAKYISTDPESIWGFGMDDAGFGINRGNWASFLSATTTGRFHAPFNLVDVMRRIAAPLMPSGIVRRPGRFVLARPPAAAADFARTLLASPAGLPQGETPAGFVALQLGASAAVRQWPVEHFAALGDRLWREARMCPILLGSSGETGLGDAYAAMARSPIVNAIGRTDIASLGALLLESRLLVSNDTGTLHLAAGLGRQSLSFFLATAQPWDTGPYLHDCCCIEPDISCHPCQFGTKCCNANSCRSMPEPALAAELALAWLGGTGWRSGLDRIRPNGARIWISDFDSAGFASLHCISGHGNSDRNGWLLEQRDFWRQFLDELDGARGAPDAGASPCTVYRACSYSREFAASIAPVFLQGVQILGILEQQGRMLGKLPKAGDLFLLNCERLQSLLDASAPFRSLGQLWRELRQTRGGDMGELMSFVGILEGNLRRWAQTRESLAYELQDNSGNGN